MGLTNRLSERERKIDEFKNEMKKYQMELDMTKSKIETEKEKLDKATEKNKGLRQILNFVMTTELNEQGEAGKPNKVPPRMRELEMEPRNRQRKRATIQTK